MFTLRNRKASDQKILSKFCTLAWYYGAPLEQILALSRDNALCKSLKELTSPKALAFVRRFFSYNPEIGDDLEEALEVLGTYEALHTCESHHDHRTFLLRLFAVCETTKLTIGQMRNILARKDLRMAIQLLIKQEARLFTEAFFMKAFKEGTLVPTWVPETLGAVEKALKVRSLRVV